MYVDIYDKEFEDKVVEMRKKGHSKKKIIEWAMKEYEYVAESVMTHRVDTILESGDKI